MHQAQKLAWVPKQPADGRVPVGHVIISRNDGEECRAALINQLMIGSPPDEENDVFLPSGHLQFSVVNSRAFAVDMKSTYGSYLRNKRMVGPHPLAANDQIVIRARVPLFSCLRPFRQSASDFVLRFELA